MITTKANIDEMTISEITEYVKHLENKINNIYNTIDMWEKVYEDEKREILENWRIDDECSKRVYSENFGACVAIKCIKNHI